MRSLAVRWPQRSPLQAPCIAGGARWTATCGARLAGPRSQHRAFFFGGSKSAGPLLNIEGLGAPKDFPRLADLAITDAKKELDAVPRLGPAELVRAVDNASNGLCRIADAAELCRNVHPDEKFVEGANDAVNLIAAYMGEANLDLGLYHAFLRAEQSDAFGDLTFEEQRCLNHMRTAMEFEGIHLPSEDKAELLELMEHEQHLSFAIVQCQEVLQRGDGTSGGIWVPVNGVRELLGPQVGALPRRTAECEEVLVPSATMWTSQILKAAPCSITRRIAFEAEQSPSHEVEKALIDLLRVRHRLARVRGYRSWNEYSQRESLMSTPGAVSEFLHGAWGRIKPGVTADLHRLSQEKQRLGLEGGPSIHPWDLQLVMQRCKASGELDRTVEEYITYSTLLRGVDLILSRLLGVSFVAEEPHPGEVWHPSVQKYTLREKGAVLGILYLDPFSRAGKAVQSAQFTVQGSKLLPGGARQVPVTSLVFSLPAGARGLPVGHAVTFMHEIGHAVHSLLSETAMQHLSGTRGAVDFVEFPSHLFEHFVLDTDCLRGYASHSKTEALMPESVANHVRESCARFAHIEAAQHLMYAIVDQAFYDSLPASGLPPESFRAADLHQQLAVATDTFDRDMAASGAPFEGSFTTLLGLAQPCKFDHLVHYGGSYYCYLFNRALSSHVWQRAFRDDPFARGTGTRLRGLLRDGSVTQDLAAIQRLCCPEEGSADGAGVMEAPFAAQHVPLDAFIARLKGGSAG